MGESAIGVMRQLGAEVIDVDIASFTQLSAFSSTVLSYEFKRDLNAYLATLGPNAPIRTLADVITYNQDHADAALKYGQTLALASDALDLEAAKPKYEADKANDLLLAKEQGIDATIDKNNLTAILFPGSGGANIAARAEYPSVIVPAGYLSTGSPYGVTFTGKAYSEATLISLAYSFEQATKLRRPPASALRLPPLSNQIVPGKVVNYASGLAGPVAPGEIVSIAGSGIGPATAASQHLLPEGRIDTVTGTARVLFDGVPAAILSAKSDQIVALVPYAVTGKTSVKMNVEYQGQRSAPVTLDVAETAPAIFTDQPLGKGTAFIQNQDGSRNSAANPAAKGSVITFFVTGEGRPQTLGIDGRPAAAPFAQPFLPVVTGVNNAGIETLYAGAAPGLTGIMQVNALLPTDLPAGGLPLVVRIGETFSPAFTVAVK